MISIKYCDIPPYLHAGDFYRSLDSDDPECIIEIPADCFEMDEDNASTLDQLRKLLQIKAFWLLDRIPLGVLNFCIMNNVEIWRSTVHELSMVGANVLPALVAAFPRHGGIPFRTIVESGRWELIVHAVSWMYKTNTKACAIAAKLGDLRLLQYLHEEGFNWDVETCENASRNGHLECLRYAREEGCPCSSNVFDVAALSGHLNCIRYAHEAGLPWSTSLCETAARLGHLDCLKYAHEHGCPWDDQTTAFASRVGHCDCLLYALQHNCPVTSQACDQASECGQLACLQLLHHYNVPWTTDTACCATVFDTIDCQQYLCENGCPWDERTPEESVDCGHITHLQYAMERGCPYSDDLISKAAIDMFTFDCLQYLVEQQGLCMNEDLFMKVLLAGNFASLEYLVDQGCPYLSAQFNDEMANITEGPQYSWRYSLEDFHEFLLCIQFAVERGWVPNQAFVDHVYLKHRPCGDWLAQEGFMASALTVGYKQTPPKPPYRQGTGLKRTNGCLNLVGMLQAQSMQYS